MDAERCAAELSMKAEKDSLEKHMIRLRSRIEETNQTRIVSNMRKTLQHKATRYEVREMLRSKVELE